MSDTNNQETGCTGSTGDTGCTGSSSGVTGTVLPIESLVAQMSRILQMAQLAVLSAGSIGPTGPTGFDGPTGFTGCTGPTGVIGPTGSNSTVTGPTGPVGIDGIEGPAGPAGAVGATGAAGAVGATGAAGAVGAVGATGADGAAGTAAVNLTAGSNLNITGSSISLNSTISNLTSIAVNGASSSDSVTISKSSGSAYNLTLPAQAPVANTYLGYIGGNYIWTAIQSLLAFVGATSSTSGTVGSVPAPTSGQQNYYLSGGGSWAKMGLGLSGETWRSVTASRTAGTAYPTVLLTYPIYVSIFFSSASYGDGVLAIDGVNVGRGRNDSSTYAYFSVAGIVPPGKRYIFTSSGTVGINNWAELY